MCYDSIHIHHPMFSIATTICKTNINYNFTYFIPCLSNKTVWNPFQVTVLWHHSCMVLCYIHNVFKNCFIWLSESSTLLIILLLKKILHISLKTTSLFVYLYNCIVLQYVYSRIYIINQSYCNQHTCCITYHYHITHTTGAMNGPVDAY